jgi:hypothetical protein
MKTFLLLTFWIGCFYSTFSQPAIKTTIDSENFRFGGSMSDEIFNNLTAEEQKAYLIGLNSLGLQKDSISWVDTDFIQKMYSEENAFSQKNLWIDTKDFKPEIDNLIEGNTILPHPKCMIFFKREEGLSYYTFQVYY